MRSQVVLAHDRSGIDEDTMKKIRSEIKEVVLKYVNIEDSGINFDINTDDRLTMLTATFELLPNRGRSAGAAA